MDGFVDEHHRDVISDRIQHLAILPEQCGVQGLGHGGTPPILDLAATNSIVETIENGGIRQSHGHPCFRADQDL